MYFSLMNHSCFSSFLKQEGYYTLQGMSSNSREIGFFLLNKNHSFISLDNNEEYAKDEIISNFFFFLDQRLHCYSLRITIFAKFKRKIIED